MLEDAQIWKKFWDAQETPLHRHNDEVWYRLYAEEINLLLASLNYKQGNVLEIGCGNGALFPYLKISKDDYLGIDFSEKLLSIFQQKYPQTTLVCADAASYITDQSFSLIFSNGVIQYLNPKALDKHIQNSLIMLKEDGILLMTNIPFRSLIWHFYGGELYAKPTKFSALRIIKSCVLEALGKRSKMGYWYSPKDFIKWQEKNVSVVFFGSLFHPYRFSVVLQRVA